MFNALLCSFILLTGIIAFIALKVLNIYQNTGWLRTALTSMGDAVITTDSHGHVTGLNEVAEKLLGWGMKEAIGKPVSELFRLVDHDTRESVENPITQVLKSRKMAKLPGNTVLIARDGGELPIDNSASPIFDTKGRFKAIVSIFRDITERYAMEQKLLESEERFKAVTDTVRIGLVMINRDRRYVYANNFYNQMVGISNTVSLLGKRVEDVLPSLYERIAPNLDQAFAGKRLSYEIKGNNKNAQGLTRIYSVTYEPQKRHSLVLHVIIVVLDITHIKNAKDIAV